MRYTRTNARAGHCRPRHTVIVRSNEWPYMGGGVSERIQQQLQRRAAWWRRGGGGGGHDDIRPKTKKSSRGTKYSRKYDSHKITE